MLALARVVALLPPPPVAVAVAVAAALLAARAAGAALPIAAPAPVTTAAAAAAGLAFPAAAAALLPVVAAASLRTGAPARGVGGAQCVNGGRGLGPGGREQRFSSLAHLRSGRQPGDLLRSDGTLPPLSSFSIASLWPHEVGILASGWAEDARVGAAFFAVVRGWGVNDGIPLDFLG